MENVTRGMRKFALCSRSDLVEVSSGAILAEYRRVSSSVKIFEPKLPIAKTAVFCASFLYLFKYKILSVGLYSYYTRFCRKRE